MKNLLSENRLPVELAQLSQKAGLVVRPFNQEVIDQLFDELEKFDESERAETFSFLKQSLNDTRLSLGAEPVYSE